MIHLIPSSLNPARFRTLGLALAAVLLLPNIANASSQPSSLPVLAKRTSTQLPNGQIREADCVVHSDGVVITRRMGPIQWTETRALSFQSHPSSSIDEIMAAPLKTQTGSPADLSYHFVAYRLSPQGILDEVVISRFDGKSGITQEREGLTAGTLKSVLNSICPF
ncbi:MAG TPA: hypothetical protein PLZ57_09610 [Pseudobdellovibrionaceae bacterium]|nr:hypothetical protein [Pseudobdellovibrionaceae bacterium]